MREKPETTESSPDTAREMKTLDLILTAVAICARVEERMEEKELAQRKQSAGSQENAGRSPGRRAALVEPAGKRRPPRPQAA